jgi:hypothetical protein
MHRVAAILTSATLCGLVFAQEDERSVRPQQERQVIRQDGQRREGGVMISGPGGGRGMMGGRMMGRMVEELDLDENQQKIYEELAAPMRERMRVQGERWRAAREAADGGDDTQLKQLQAEFQQQGGPGRGGPFGGADPFGEIFEQLEPHLRPDQVDKLDNMRDRMDRDRESMDSWRRISDELPGKLNLDEAQKQQFDEALQAAREETGQRWQAMRPIFEQMQEARDAGDNERVAELRQQFEQQRPDGTAQLQGLLGQIEQMLRDDQKEAFAEFQNDIGIGTGGDAADAGGLTDVRAILRVAKRLRMTSEQKDDFRALERQAMRSLRVAGRDQAAKAELAERVKEQIEQLLDDTQKERFQSQLERLSRRNRR